MKSLMSIAVFVACLLLGINRNGATEAAERWPSIVSGSSAAVQRIHQALDEPTQMEFVETSLDQVINNEAYTFGVGRSNFKVNTDDRKNRLVLAIP